MLYCLIAYINKIVFLDTSNSNELIFIKQAIVSNQLCSKIWTNLQNSNICGFANERQTTCQSDSGGPLVCSVQISATERIPVLVGIASYGSNPCDKDTPTVYESATHFLDFFEGNSNGTEIDIIKYQSADLKFIK